MFREIRRQDRKLNDEYAVEILKKGEYGILSTISPNGYPYGVPLNYVYIDGNIYFHCAKEGHKLDNITKNDKVSFCVVGETSLIPESFSTRYESVVIFGQAVEVDSEEKERVLMDLLKKYAHEYMKEGKTFIKDVGKDTKVIKINIQHISGKGRR